jgi:hypothetical protein
MSSRPGSTPDGRPLTAALLYGGSAAGVIALHLSTNSTFGFHTDELYYLACGRHAAVGLCQLKEPIPKIWGKLRDFS